MTSAINLTALPAPAVEETLDYAATFERLVASMKRKQPSYSGLASDPITQLFEITANEITQIRHRINAAAKQVMLPYAAGTNLDNLGVLYNLSRNDNENDVDFRNRLLSFPESLTNAGTMQAYIYHAHKIQSDLLDLKVEYGGNGLVNVWVAMDDQSDASVLSRLLTGLSADDVRPIGDHVVVRWATQKVTTINLQIRATTEAAVTAAKTAVENFVNANRKIGGKLVLSQLIDAAHVENVSEIVVQSPNQNIQFGSAEIGVFSVNAARLV